MRRDTAELVARLRDYDNCHDGDVDDAAARLEELQKIVDEIPRLVDEIVSDCRIEWIDQPSIYQRGSQWRYHKIRASNTWNDGNTPLEAVRGINSRV